jgi:trans-aconitate 2-methyltransferase
MSWSATQYLPFEQERTRAMHDLLAAPPVIQARIVKELGCDSGTR